MGLSNHQTCTLCVMDSTIPGVTFDESGICSCCRQYDSLQKKMPNADGKGSQRLEKIISEIKENGKGKPYDCIVGISGGVDSSYVMALCHDYGLRPYAVHMDNGWNTEISDENVKKIMTKLEIPLHATKLDWEEFKNLQKAFLKSSTPHCEHPTDHAILATVYKAAVENKIQYIISGSNFSSEGIGIAAGSVGQRDWLYIKSINQRFSSSKLKHYPHFSLLDLFIHKAFYKEKTINILDYIDYNKEKAMQELSSHFGWKYYGGKHFESIYTRFFQAYILPVKFNIDKRKAHLSSLIKSGQLTRELALEELSRPACPESILQEDKKVFLEKLELTESQFEEIMKLPPKSFEDYPSYDKTWYYKVITRIYFILKPIFKM